MRSERPLVQQSSPQAIGQMGIGKVLHGKVVHLAGRLPQIWKDPATTDAQRKALLRCLVDKIVLDPVLAVLAGKLEARRSDCAPLAGKYAEPAGTIARYSKCPSGSFASHLNRLRGGG